MNINLLNMNELAQYKKMIEKKIQKYEEMLKSIDECMRNENCELPMPLYYNDITHNSVKHQKSKKYTKCLIDKLIKRKTAHVTSIEEIHVKQEPIEETKSCEMEMDMEIIINGNVIEEELEMPPLEYA
jgi:hypothetical protein